MGEEKHTQSKGFFGRMVPKSRKDEGGRRRDYDCDDCRQGLPHPTPAKQSSRKSSSKAVPQSKGKVVQPTPPTPPTKTKSAKVSPPTQPVPVRPRPATTQPYRAARPVSYHSGVPAEPLYMQPTYPEQRDAQGYATPPLFAPSSYPPRPSYFHAGIQPIPPYQETFSSSLPSPETHSRPPLRQWPSDQTRHSVMPPFPPIIEQPFNITYSMPLSRSTSYRGQPSKRPEVKDSRDEDYRRMPPPPPGAAASRQAQRPTIRRAAATIGAHQSPLRQSLRPIDTFQAPARRQSPTKENAPTHSRMSTPISAPFCPDCDKAHALHAPDPPSARPRLERLTTSGSKQSRRVSYHGHANHLDLERSVEDYQNSLGNTPSSATNSFPLTSETLNLVRPKTNPTSASTSSRASSTRGSKGGSAQGSRAGSGASDGKSRGRVLMAGEDTKTSLEGVPDEEVFSMHVSKDAHINIKGDAMEGKDISLRPSERADGSYQLSVGPKAGSSGASSRDRGRTRRYSHAESIDSRSKQESRMQQIVESVPQSVRKHRDDGASTKSRRSSRVGR